MRQLKRPTTRRAPIPASGADSSRNWRQRRGFALTALVVMVLAAAAAALTMASTSLVRARAEQLRRERDAELGHMLEAGKQWIRAGGLQEASPEVDTAIRLRLPTVADASEATSANAMENDDENENASQKVLVIRRQADGQLQLTASLVRNGAAPSTTATRTVQFDDPSNEAPAEASAVDAADAEPAGDNSEQSESDGGTE